MLFFLDANYYLVKGYEDLLRKKQTNNARHERLIKRENVRPGEGCSLGGNRHVVLSLKLQQEQ